MGRKDWIDIIMLRTTRLDLTTRQGMMKMIPVMIISIRRQIQHQLIATQAVMHVKLQMVTHQAVEDLMILLKRYKS